MNKPQWYDLGQHQYHLFAAAQIKHFEMRDAGHTTRVKLKNNLYCVQIWE